MTRKYQDRFEAGRILLSHLQSFASRPDAIVLTLPRGGVPVGYEIARGLNLPLDVFVVRKLGVPGHEELALGALASGGVRVLNEDVIRGLNLPEDLIEAVSREQKEELNRRETRYRDGRPPVTIDGWSVILVDDGLATGATMRAAVQALRQRKPASITVAVPVGSGDTCAEFKEHVEEIICGRTPDPFHAVGLWYEDFTQLTDDEVTDLLNHAAHERRVRLVRERKAIAPNEEVASRLSNLQAM